MCAFSQLKPCSCVESRVHHDALACTGRSCCVQTNGDRMEISWRHAEEHAKTAIVLGRRCKPPEAALEASPLTTMGDIASAMCRFPVAKERCMPMSYTAIPCKCPIIVAGRTKGCVYVCLGL